MRLIHILLETHTIMNPRFSNFYMWRFDPIPCHGLPLRGFVITPVGYATLASTPLDEWSVRRRELYRL